MLEPILKGLIEWLYSMMLDIMSYASGELLGVMSMDLSYFERTAPIITDIVNVFIALGWALLIGNLVFQSLKVMMSGAGFEAEDPKLLFFRTFVFSFLLLASRQICEIGSSITGTVIALLDLPDSITITVPDESMFSLGGGAKWLLVIIVGIVLMVQMVKLLFEIGERYVITSVLTFFAPLAFSMGGSKNTNDIFKGWVRMYCSMLIMMIMNIVFLKLIMSAMSQMMSGGVLIWLVFVVALTRVARKIDSHIGKIGLNPAQTGSGIGSRMPGIMTMMAVRVMSSTVSKSLAGSKGSSGSNGNSGKNGNSGTRHRSRSTGGGVNRNGQQRGNSGTHGNSMGGTNPNVAGGKGGNASAKGTAGQGTKVHTQNPLGGNNAKSPNPNTGTQKVPNTNGGTQRGGARTTNNSSVHNNSHTARNSTQNSGTHQTSGATPSRPPLNRNTAGGKTQHTTYQGGNGHNVQVPHPNLQRGHNPVNGGKEHGVNTTVPRGQNGGSQGAGASYETEHYTTSPSYSENGFTQKSGRVNVSGGYRSGYNVSGGDVHTTNNGDNDNSVHMTDSEHTHSEHTGREHFAEKNSQQSRHSQERFSSQKTEKQTGTVRKENHEYKHGRHNPAAVNKKVKKDYYRKETPEERKIRGENNRKHKR